MAPQTLLQAAPGRLYLPRRSPLASTPAAMAVRQGTARPGDPARYRLDLSADGHASLQLDCNRASATWQATPAMPAAADAASRSSGSLLFAALASTRAQCLPGSLAPRVAGALPFVRGYMLQGGQLHLTLLADGGILSWAPAP
jgi:hypothetical protein